MGGMRFNHYATSLIVIPEVNEKHRLDKSPDEISI